MLFDIKRTIGSLLLVLAIGVTNSYAQSAFSCYVVADKPGQDDLYLYDLGITPGDPGWETSVTGGTTGTDDIEAIEYNPTTNLLRAWNGGDFGTINTLTETFSSAGTTTGEICGDQRGSYVCYDGTSTDFGHESGTWDVDGMAINPNSGVFFAVARVDDKNTPPDELGLDWLFVTDANGVAIPDFFGTDAQNRPIGFVEVQSVTAADGTILHDVDDLTYVPNTGQLIGISNVSGAGGTDTHVVEINQTDGSVTDLGPLEASIDCSAGNNTLLDVEGLSATPGGQVFAVTGDDALACANSMWQLSGPFNGTPLTAQLQDVMSEEDQESISCQIFDPVSVGDRIWYDADFDGLQTPGEIGVPDVIMYVTNSAGDTLGTTITVADGIYGFGGLVPDPNGYTVHVGAENFLPGGKLSGAVQTGDPGGPGGLSTVFTSDPLPNGFDEDLTLDWGYNSPNLPVELVGFSAETNDGQIDLAWSTQSEEGNSGFAVETSASGNDFEQIGWVVGNGTTTEAQSYEYNFTPKNFGPIYVRLKQVDFDGQFSYSPVLLVDSDVPDSYILGYAYPNPFNPQTSLTLSLKNSESISVDLFDSMGRQVRNVLDGIQPANQAIEIRVDGSNLPSGNYILKIQGESFAAIRTLSLMK